MKKIYMMLMLAGLSFLGVSCGDDDTVVDSQPPVGIPDNPVLPTYPTFDAPDWSVNNINSFENTMTVVIVLPDSLKSNEDASDKLAVFVEEDCRGIAERLEVSTGQFVWLAMVYGNTSSDVLQFHYYSGKSKHKYYSVETTSYIIDGGFGTIDAPKTVGMKIVTK